MVLFKSKLVRCLVILITVFAISSPFWLFHSEEGAQDQPQSEVEGKEEVQAQGIDQTQSTEGTLYLSKLNAQSTSTIGSASANNKSSNTANSTSQATGRTNELSSSDSKASQEAILNKTSKNDNVAKGRITERAPKADGNANERVKAKIAANSNTSASISNEHSNINASNKISRAISDQIDSDYIDDELSKDPNLDQPHITELLVKQQSNPEFQNIANSRAKGSSVANVTPRETATNGTHTTSQESSNLSDSNEVVKVAGQDSSIVQANSQNQSQSQDQGRLNAQGKTKAQGNSIVAAITDKAEQCSASDIQNHTDFTNNSQYQIKQAETIEKAKTAEKSKQATGAVTDNRQGSTVIEGTVAENNSLQAQVDAIVNKKTAEDKDRYQQAQDERYKQVNWVVETIRSSSRIYLPESLGSKAVIVFFGVDVNPPKPGKQEVDSLTGASKLALEPEVIYTEHGKKYKERYAYGSGVKYIAKMLHEESGSTLYDITTVYAYPKDSVLLYETAFRQQTAKQYPELMDDQSIDFMEYDTIYLCYAIWWEDLPMPVYSFLDKYDLSGKLIIPICLSRKDGFEKTISRLRTAEPNATISNAWRIRPPELEKAEFRQDLKDWLVNLEQQLSEGTYN